MEKVEENILKFVNKLKAKTEPMIKTLDKYRLGVVLKEIVRFEAVEGVESCNNILW